MKPSMMLAIAACLLTCALASGQDETTVSLGLHPAGVASPALRYELAPPLAEMRNEDAEPLYQTAIKLSESLQEGSPLGELLDREELTRPEREQLVDLFAPVLAELRLAARCTQCQWKHRIREEGSRAKLPYLSQMRVMALGVAATVRHHASRGEFDSAIAGLQVGLAMGRHLENDAVLVQALVGTGINLLMLQEIEYLLQQPGAPNLYWALTTMPRPMRDPRSVMQWERGWLGFTFPALRDPMTMSRQQWAEVRQGLVEIQKMSHPDKEVEPEAQVLSPAGREALLRQGLSEQQIDAMEPWRASSLYAVSEYRRLESEMWKGWLLPSEQAAEQISRAVDEVSAVDQSGDAGLLLQFLPSISRARDVLDLTDRRIDALRIVEAIHAEGRIPEKSADLELPVPDLRPPITYHRDGDQAIIDARLPWQGKSSYDVVYRLKLEP